MSSKFIEICARKLALLHSYELPLAKDNEWILDTSRKLVVDYEQLDKTVAGVEKSDLDTFNRILGMNFIKEFTFVENLARTSDSPIVLIHNDLRMANFLLLEHPDDPDDELPDEDDLMLIDYEFCAYRYT